MFTPSARSTFALLLLAACVAPARGGDIQAEKASYLPLVAGSTYEYDATFQGRQSQRPVTVKSVTQEKTELFYFVSSEDRDRPVIIGTEIFTKGVCIRRAGGIAVIPCFWETNIQNLKVKEDAVLVLKDPPAKGQTVRYEIPGRPEQGHREHLRLTVEGKEDVTVPAGTFKDCVKIRTDEEWSAGKQGAAVTYTGHVWLAKGVGVVKWELPTGRVEVLVKYRVGEGKRN